MPGPSTRRKLLALWGVTGLLLAGILVPGWRPLHAAWRCYHLHANGVREQARVMHKLEERATFGLMIEEGPHAGQGCTAGTSREIYEATHEGDLLEVVYVEWKPGSCELATTLEASAQLLWLVTGAGGAAVLALLAFGLWVHRSLTRPAVLSRRLAAEAREVRCPACGKIMDEGYVPLLAGLHWRRPEDPVGLPHALGGLPGTVGWRGRPLLHAFRCTPCEILTLQYGKPK